jgi:RES domain-containing protein
MEAVVHLELNDGIIPDTYQLLRVAVPERVSRRLIEISSLEPDWAERSGYTRGLGDRWIREAGTALLGVPSAIVPETTNWLLNPRHPDAAEARIEWGRRFGFDQRFFSFSVPAR